MSKYTKEEVAKHDSMMDAWTIIHGKVYKLGEYVFGHPGGSDLILSVAGQDGSDAFEAIFHSTRARKVLEGMYIGDLDLGEQSTKSNTVKTAFVSHREEKKEISPIDKHIKETNFVQKDGFQPHKLLKITDISSNTKIFTFENKGFHFLPGNHVQTRVIDNFESIVRKYTPISYTQDTFDLLIKKYDKGVMSSHIHSLKVGDTLDMNGPCGTVLTDKDFETKKIVMIAGGTGLTPMIPLLKNFKDHKKALLFATQRENLYLYDDLKNSGVNLRILLNERDRVKQDEPHITYGRIDEDILIKGVNLGTEKTKFMVCGPDGFVDAVVAILKGLNYKDKDIHVF